MLFPSTKHHVHSLSLSSPSTRTFEQFRVDVDHQARQVVLGEHVRSVE